MHVIDNSNNEIRGGGIKRDVGGDEKQLIKFSWPWSISIFSCKHWPIKVGGDGPPAFDYYSCYFEVAKLPSMTSQSIVHIFARHGIPGTVISDNGPQYSASLFN